MKNEEILKILNRIDKRLSNLEDMTCEVRHAYQTNKKATTNINTKVHMVQYKLNELLRNK